MNTIPLLFIFWILLLTGSFGAPSDDLRDAFVETGVTERTPPPSLGERVVNPYYLEDLKALPLDKKKKLAAQLTRIIPLLVQERTSGPMPQWEYSLTGISLLREIGTDEQKIEAFGNLEFYRGRTDAYEALATCEGSEGVRILKQFAESQLPEIELRISQFKSGSIPKGNTDQVYPEVKFDAALMALQGAYHNDGPPAAAALYDKMKILYGDLLSERERLKIEGRMKIASQRRENYIREKHPEINQDINKRNVDERSSASVSDPLPTKVSSKWFWLQISIGMLILSIISWLLIRRKTVKLS